MTTNNRTVVKASLASTINLGNFQNVKIDVGIEDYVRDGENASDAFERVYAFVEAKLMAKIEETVKEIKDAGV